MNSILAFFQKYKLYINIILIALWLIIIYYHLVSSDFKIAQLIFPILFIISSLFNINQIIKSRKK